MQDTVAIDVEEEKVELKQVANTENESESGDDFESANESDEISDENLTQSPEQLRRSTRARKPPGEWWKSGGSSDKNLLMSKTEDESMACLHAAISSCEAPKSYAEAMSADNIDFWKPGVEKEEDAIRENETFALVDRKPDMHVLPCRYVFRVKQGMPKVRIVAKGFRQVQGVDYHETFAPVVSLPTMRCFLSIASSLDLECDQMDVVTAFLNGDVEEEIYMEVPAGFRDPANPNLVCKLQKALYGLKQAPRQWYAKINTFLVNDLHFSNSKSDACLYIKRNDSNVMMILLYVDDILIAGSCRVAIDKVKSQFKLKFKMKDLGAVREFLGIEIKRDRTNYILQLTQSTYIAKVLERFEMAKSKPVSTPMTPDFQKSLMSSKSQALSPSVPYRSAIGSLMYLMICTRPDIAYAVGKLSQNCESPTNMHWNAVKCILRYINGTRTVGLRYQVLSNRTSQVTLLSQ